MKIYYLFTIAFFYSHTVFSQIVQETGSVQYQYSPSVFSGKPKADELAEAFKAAKLNALRRYISGLDQNSRLNYSRIQASVEADIDTIVPNVSLLRNDYDKRQKLIFITLKAGIDTSLLRDRLVRSGTVAQIPSKEKSYVCGAFVARRQASVTRFRTKIVDVNRNDRSSEEFQEVSSDGISSSSVADQRVETSRTTGGASTTQSNKVIWSVFPSEVLDSGISGILKTAGYRLVPASSLGRKSDGLINLDSINEDYSRGNDLSQATRDDMIEGCEKLRITYLSTGTLNVEAPMHHPVTGATKVTVSVNVQVWDVGGLLPEVVASIGPIQYSALGDSQSTAENNAIKLASENAGQLIVSGLQQANAK